MTEKGKPLPYPLDACAGCRDLTEQLAAAIAEQDDLRKDRDDAVDMREGSLMRVDGLQQQLVQAQAARTICDVHQAEFDRLEQQLAEVTAQLADLTQQLALAQMELRERAKDCTEHCEDFTRAQLQLNTVKRKLATVTSALDVLCEAIERGEPDEDYLRRRAAECRTALAQGRGA